MLKAALDPIPATSSPAAFTFLSAETNAAVAQRPRQQWLVDAHTAAVQQEHDEVILAALRTTLRKERRVVLDVARALMTGESEIVTVRVMPSPYAPDFDDARYDPSFVEDRDYELHNDTQTVSLRPWQHGDTISVRRVDLHDQEYLNELSGE